MQAGTDTACERIAVSELLLPASAAKLSAARRYAEDAAAAFGLDGDGCFAFAVAANEAVTNAIRHGAPDAWGRIHLSVLASAERLTLMVRDFGTFKAPARMRSTTSEHGRGFTLMATLVDEVQLCAATGNTTVRLTKARE
jgi:anti-sigma regulatory factor (Ser/Thr protein kinase)